MAGWCGAFIVIFSLLLPRSSSFAFFVLSVVNCPSFHISDILSIAKTGTHTYKYMGLSLDCRQRWFRRSSPFRVFHARSCLGTLKSTGFRKNTEAGGGGIGWNRTCCSQRHGRQKRQPAPTAHTQPGGGGAIKPGSPVSETEPAGGGGLGAYGGGGNIICEPALRGETGGRGPSGGQGKGAAVRRRGPLHSGLWRRTTAGLGGRPACYWAKQ